MLHRQWRFDSVLLVICWCTSGGGGGLLIVNKTGALAFCDQSWREEWRSGVTQAGHRKGGRKGHPRIKYASSENVSVMFVPLPAS